jgi:CHAT domain-containing protein/Tfp pilus assembly protein PilF
VTLVLAFIAALLFAQAPAAPPRILSANLPVQATLAGGERAFYAIDVPANHAARVIVQQQGIDVGVMLRRRGSKTPEHGLDFVSAPAGEERQYPPVLDTASTWDIRIGAQLPKAARASYTITVEVAPADARDRALAAAHATHYDASEASWVNDYRRAHGLYAAAADAALALGDLSIAAESTFQRARMHDQFGDTPGAIEWQLRALDLFKRIDQKDRQSRVLNRLGDLSRKVGAVSDSERYFEQALPLAEGSRDLVSVADIGNNSGLLMLATGRPEDAIARLESAMPLALEVNSANVEVALRNNLAESYRRLGRYDKAIEMALGSMPAVARLNLPRRTARTFYMLAGSYYENGDLDRADEAIKKSLDLYRQTEDRLGYADSLALAARMMYASGDTDRALATFAEAQPLLQKGQNRFGEASLLTSWADVDIDRGDYASALAKLDTAIALSRAIANSYTETKGEYLRAVAYQRSDRLDDAVAAIRRAIDNVETMRGSIARSDLRTSYLAAVRSYYDLYVDLLQRRGDAAGAFEVSERARARALLEGLAESSAKIQKGADAGLLAKQRAIQRELNAKETYRAEVVLRDGKNSPAARAVEGEVERLLDQWKSVRAQMRVASPAYAALQQPQPINLKQLQGSLLDAGSAMVAYHLGRDRSYVWVIDRNAVVVETLPAMAQIDDVARRYHEALSRELESLTAPQRQQASAAAAAAGRELAALVWKPIEAKVKGRRLLIVADRALHYVPFAALPTSAGAPVLAAHEVVYLPSASVLASLRADSRRVTLTASTAVFADPVFSKADPRFATARDVSMPSQSRASDGGLYGRLRFSRREAEAIGERAPGAYQALDFAASKSAVTARDLRKYKVLHFATHGSLNTAHPELSGLVLSLYDKGGKPIDGFLRLHEIYNLDLDADLVVLSACRTALGREVHGEGLIGLTRGFMYAGASRVVSSVWNIDDRASALLMSRFYDAMRTKQLAPAAALRDAQLSLMNDPRWSNPHYWAAFGIQGEWK